jgi:transcriptional regulator with XRE-family HTH domain
MDAADVLREARGRSGLTIRQLARRGGTSHSAVAAYESGAKTPTAATLVRLVNACGFDAQLSLRPRDAFEDRRRRGRELREVLDLADRFPQQHRPLRRRRFPAA